MRFLPNTVEVKPPMVKKQKVSESERVVLGELH